MRLKELRKSNKITQKELATAIGVTGQTILNWENGIFEPSINELIKLADYFNVTIDYLVERKVNNNDVELICNKLKDIEKEKLIDFIKTELNKMK